MARWLSASLALPDAILDNSYQGNKTFPEPLLLFQSRTPFGVRLFGVDVCYDLFPTITHAPLPREQVAAGPDGASGRSGRRCSLWAELPCRHKAGQTEALNARRRHPQGR